MIVRILTHLKLAKQTTGELHVYAQAGFRDCIMIVTVVFILALIPAWVMGRNAR